MSDHLAPYRITGPAIVSFSGGRTSAYMLRHILLAHGGTLPLDVVVTFSNTGKERVETLDFVQECSTHWNVPIVWLQWRDGEHGQRYEIVNHNSAARHGEPFDALIDKKPMLPNPMLRYCTTELKIRVMRDYARSLGWEHWTNIVGLRADEASRVSRALERERERWVNRCPLAEAGVTEGDVLVWWSRQPFDLRLRPHEGNCDLCFLKARGKIEAIMRARPELAQWWIEREAAGAGRGDPSYFRADRPGYADMLAHVQASPELPFFDLMDDSLSCQTGCTD